MPDDDRTRRRLGDETKSRIADLASGWSVDAPASPEPPAAPTAPPAPDPSASAPRVKPRTNPPPPPGSAGRKALEDAILATSAPSHDHAAATSRASPLAPAERSKPASIPPPVPAAAERSKPASIPPPVPPAAERSKPASIPPPVPPAAERSKPASIPPPVPPAAERSKRASVPPPVPPAAERSKPASVPPPVPPAERRPTGAPFAKEQGTFTREQRTPAVIVDASVAEAVTPAATRGASTGAPEVPVGEFDSAAHTVDERTVKRDPGVALLAAVASREEPLVIGGDDAARGDPTTVDPQTAKFERGDPTQDIVVPDATEVRPPRSKHPTSGTLRRAAALRRKRGLLGDVRYVFTAVFGVRESRRELVELEHRQEVRQTSRKRHLVTLGRAAAVMDGFDHPALGKAREQLGAIEDERSKHAGAVAASDAELDRVRRDRETKARHHAAERAAADAELDALAKKLEPLEKEAAGVKKRGQELRDELHRIERKIAETEALLVSVKAEKMDKAAIQADIATFKANKQAVLRDEPVIAAELDALSPRLAAIEASRAALHKKKGEIDKTEQDDQRRTLELLEAIGAKRKVVERAAADAEVARDQALFELGERLYVDRPQALTPQLAPIDRIDLELGEDDRRIMDLKEILSNVDRWKFARGLTMFILALTAVGAFFAWVLHMTL